MHNNPKLLILKLNLILNIKEIVREKTPLALTEATRCIAFPLATVTDPHPGPMCRPRGRVLGLAGPDGSPAVGIRRYARSHVRRLDVHDGTPPAAACDARFTTNL